MAEQRTVAVQSLPGGFKAVPRTVVNLGAWAAAFGGVAASLVPGAVLIPLGAAVVGAILGLGINRKLDQTQHSSN
jgi:hypothetical protein